MPPTPFHSHEKRWINNFHLEKTDKEKGKKVQVGFFLLPEENPAAILFPKTIFVSHTNVLVCPIFSSLS